jgi:hypothetical protein
MGDVRCLALVLASFVLLGGCAGKPGTPSAADPDPVPGFLPASASLPAGSPIPDEIASAAVGSTVVFLAGQDEAGAPAFMVYDFRSASLASSKAGGLPGRPGAVFADASGGRVFFASNIVAQTGVASWIDFAAYDLANATWTTEQAPSRWTGSIVEGLVAMGGHPIVLLSTHLGRELWMFTSQWTRIPVIGSSPFNLFALGRNETTAVVAGKTDAGAIGLWAFDPATTALHPWNDGATSTALSAARLAPSIGTGVPHVFVQMDGSGPSIREATPGRDGSWRFGSSGLEGAPVAAVRSSEDLYFEAAVVGGTQSTWWRQAADGTWVPCDLRAPGPHGLYGGSKPFVVAAEGLDLRFTELDVACPGRPSIH